MGTPPHGADDEPAATVVDPLFADEPEVPDYPAVDRIGHYDVLGRLASGGMADIFLARDRVGDAKFKHVALKCIGSHVLEDAYAIQMFLDEARVASRLYHPNICHVFEAGEEEETHFMAIEWVHGPPLRRVLRRARERGGMPLPIAVKIAAILARALEYVHEARGEGGRPLGIVHRDVTPHNVVLSWKGAVKLLDFGIAKAATQHAKTESGIMKGKYAYLAPEQWRAEKIDRRVDVFALGICLYELLTCQPLYNRGSVIATMNAIIAEPVPALRASNPHFPAELDAIVQRALQKDPAARFPTAGEMAEALEQFLDSSHEVVTSTRIARLLDRLFDEEDRLPLPPISRETGSFGSPENAPIETPTLSRAERPEQLPISRPSPLLVLTVAFLATLLVATALWLWLP